MLWYTSVLVTGLCLQRIWAKTDNVIFFSNFLTSMQQNLGWGVFRRVKREFVFELCTLVALHPLNGFWPDISLFLRLVLAFEKAP